MKKGAVGGKKNPEPDQEALCRDGDAANRQRILTIAATLIRDAKGRAPSALLPSERQFRIPHGVKNSQSQTPNPT